MKSRIIFFTTALVIVFASCQTSRFQKFNKQKFLKGKISQKFGDSVAEDEEVATKNFDEIEQMEVPSVSESKRLESEEREVTALELEEEQGAKELLVDDQPIIEKDFPTDSEELFQEEEVDEVSDAEESPKVASRDFQTEMSLFFYAVICVLAVLCYFLLALIFTFQLGPWVFIVALGLAIIAVVLAIILHVYDFDFVSGILAWYLYSIFQVVLVMAFGITLWALAA